MTSVVQRGLPTTSPRQQVATPCSMSSARAQRKPQTRLSDLGEDRDNYRKTTQFPGLKPLCFGSEVWCLRFRIGQSAWRALKLGLKIVPEMVYGRMRELF